MVDPLPAAPAMPAPQLAQFDKGLVLALLTLAGAAILGAAFAFEIWGKLAPCALCLAQRWPYVAVIAFGVMGAAGLGGVDWRPVFLAGVAAALFVTGGFGVYHVAVEKKWVVASCADGTPIRPLTIEDIAKASAGPPAPRCDAVPWQLFGISMAGYNALLGLGLGGAGLLALLVLPDSRRKGA